MSYNRSTRVLVPITKTFFQYFKIVNMFLYNNFSFKVATINHFYINKESQEYLHMKEVARSDEFIETYHPPLHFPSAL